MNKLALFDIDWTLMKPSEAHRLAFIEGYKQVYGVDADHDKLNVQGWTDKRIICESLRLARVDEQTIEEKLDEAMTFISRYFSGIIDNHPLVIMHGAEELLKELYKNNVMLGVLTGNLEAIAQEKLRKLNLSKYFITGYFGDKSKFRSDLAKKAADDASGVYNIPRDNIFIIGDTPRDINAGKAAGVRTIGVASGIYSVKELLGAEPDLVISGLYEIEPVKKLILG